MGKDGRELHDEALVKMKAMVKAFAKEGNGGMIPGAIVDIIKKSVTPAEVGWIIKSLNNTTTI